MALPERFADLLYADRFHALGGSHKDLLYTLHYGRNGWNASRFRSLYSGQDVTPGKRRPGIKNAFFVVSSMAAEVLIEESSRAENCCK